MADERETARRERVFMASFVQCADRLKKRGLSNDDAARVASKFAEEVTNRRKTPLFASPEDYADFVGTVCKKLGEGKSYLETIEDLPFLTTRRIDGVIKAAAQSPVVDAGTTEFAVAASDARRAKALEALSGRLAVLLMAVALGTLGLWYAIAVGIVVSVVAEAYIQTAMPSSLRRAAARVHLSAITGLVAAVALLFFGVRWIMDVEHPIILGVVAGVVIVLITTLVPALTMGCLFWQRSGTWKRDLEKKLLEERSQQ
jgi:hypothetical protein